MRILLLVMTLACISAFPGVARGDGPNYTVDKDKSGVWWFVAPDGTKFYSLGISDVNDQVYMPRPNSRYYRPVEDQFGGDEQAWARSTRELLLSNGFNTLGSWSSGRVPAGNGLHRTPILYVVGNSPTRCLTPLRPDFEAFVRTSTREAIAKWPDRTGIIGVFLDNEMSWYGKSGWDDLPTYTLLEQAMGLDAGDPLRAATLAWIKQRHATVADLGAAYGRPVKSWDEVTGAYLQMCVGPGAKADREAFTKMIGDKFFEVSTRVVHEELPGMLILGVRFPSKGPESVVRACGKYCDVMSVNAYNHEPKADVANLTMFWVLGGKPIMHTEFSWRARQNTSGCPNTRGAGSVLETQAERGAMYAGLVADTATIPYMIGSHWFEFADQSPEGRFDGEDSNYGVVDIHNAPYSELLSSMKETNARVRDLHAATRRVMPTELPKPVAVTYEPGQHPERPAKLELITEWTHDPEAWGAPDAWMKWSRRGSDLVLGYNAGAQYGAGVNIFGPKSSALAHGPKFATDLDGYNAFVIEAVIPQGLQVNVVIAEAGAGPSTNAKFDTSAGDDGEGFISAPIFGDGRPSTYRLPISGFLRQQFFGNQHGKQRIDMQAIRNVGVQAQGEPRQGEIVITSLRLEK